VRGTLGVYRRGAHENGSPSDNDGEVLVELADAVAVRSLSPAV
jgi:hypothetical protein